MHEIKHDGFRVIARKSGDRVRLYSRPGNDLTKTLPAHRRGARPPASALLRHRRRGGVSPVPRPLSMAHRMDVPGPTTPAALQPGREPISDLPRLMAALREGSIQCPHRASGSSRTTKRAMR
jgi:hypothetical protein